MFHVRLHLPIRAIVETAALLNTLRRLVLIVAGGFLPPAAFVMCRDKVVFVGPPLAVGQSRRHYEPKKRYAILWGLRGRFSRRHGAHPFNQGDSV